jgi:hypothetical protein
MNHGDDEGNRYNIREGRGFIAVAKQETDDAGDLHRFGMRRAPSDAFD